MYVFGLKDVAKAMHSHGFIESIWNSDCVDGKSAMIIAQKCHDVAKRKIFQ